MAVRMIAVDMDDTLLNFEKKITSRTRAAVRHAMEAGALFVLNSGRMLEVMKRYADELAVNAPIICFNGALTYDVKSGRAIASQKLEKESARAISRYVEQAGAYIQGFWGNAYYFEKYTEHSRYYAEKNGLEGVQTDAPLSEFIPEGVYKLLIMGNAGETARLIPGLRGSFGEQAEFVSSSPKLLECVKRGATKGAALIKLAASRGIAPSEIMAFGDEQNDLSMLTVVEHGYAMANADESVRRQVLYVAPSCEEDGVAQVIERYLEAGQIEKPRG